MSSLAIVMIPALLFTKLYPSWSRNLEYEFENKLLNLQHQNLNIALSNGLIFTST